MRDRIPVQGLMKFTWRNSREGEGDQVGRADAVQGRKPVLSHSENYWEP